MLNINNINIDSFEEEYIEIEKEISKIDYSEWESLNKILKRKKLLEEIIKQYNEKRKIEEEIEN